MDYSHAHIAYFTLKSDQFYGKKQQSLPESLEIAYLSQPIFLSVGLWGQQSQDVPKYLAVFSNLAPHQDGGQARWVM